MQNGSFTGTKGASIAIEVRIKTVVLPGGKIEISDPELVVGEEVTVVVTSESKKPVEQRSILEMLESFPKHRIFKTGAEVDAYIREECDAWDR